MKDEEYYRILDRIVSYCAYAERCLQDIRQQFRKFELTEEYKEKIIDYLIEYDVLDEKRYALSFATGKLRYNKWGRVKIRAHLKSKYISDKDIHFAFGELDDEEYDEVLTHILERKIEKLGDDDDKFAKVVRHAQSRGFELGLVIEKLKTLEF